MRALDDQVRPGKVLYLAISDAPAWVIARANNLAEERGWTPFVAMQMQYSLIERSVEREDLPLGQVLDLAVTAWSPLGMGLLSKRCRLRRSAGEPQSGGVALRPWSLISKVVGEVASELDATSAQVALAWVKA
jgi:aryl-alcohol dehydrogenase-like predicted oxidoreductase